MPALRRKSSVATGGGAGAGGGVAHLARRFPWRRGPRCPSRRPSGSRRGRSGRLRCGPPRRRPCHRRSRAAETDAATWRRWSSRRAAACSRPAARATEAWPIVPEAPGRLSTTTLPLSSFESCSARTRATKSVDPPGAQATTRGNRAAAGIALRPPGRGRTGRGRGRTGPRRGWIYDWGHVGSSLSSPAARVSEARDPR